MEKDHLVIEQTQTDIEKINHKYNTICNLRLGICIIGLILLVLSIINKDKLLFFSFIMACILFIILIMIHEKLWSKKEYMIGKLDVLQKRYKRGNNEWNNFNDTGEEFLSKRSNIERDLDIFGPNSLYQYLCTAITKDGKERLASFLTEQNPDITVLRERQKAIQELLEKSELSLDLEIYSTLIGKKNKNEQNEWYQSFLQYILLDKKLLSTSIYILSWLLPIITITSCFMFVKFKTNIEQFFILFILQASVAYLANYKNQKNTKKTINFCQNIGIYYKMIETIQNADFKAGYLKNIQKLLATKQPATDGIAKLYTISEAFKIQSNPYVHFILQGFLMYDVHCIRLLEKWKKNYGKNVNKWFHVIGEMEALISLSVLGLDKDVVYPIFVEESETIWTGNELYHPLIASNKVVSNSIQLRGETGIITGSNMSGKTTFLRTIGMNTVLAYAGAPVCAKKLHLSKMKVFTSMRVIDDISMGISTFYAEVLRIKEMVEFSKRKKPCLILIDEIFKGTNSTDRIIGAKEVIRNLSKSHTILLVSTHDFELCDLIKENALNGRNYHFQEYYKNDQIFFDYKLKDGKCQTTNAKYILKMAGIL